MQRLWFVSNVSSGTATPAKCEAIEAVFEERGLVLAGRTRFPDEPLPDPGMLARERVDTVALFAGDGTVNATLCRLADWDGAVLILPGGTMNLLSKVLHDTLDPHAIIHAAHEDARRVALPFAEAGPHRAFVGLIVGPAAHWVRAREAVRHHRWALFDGEPELLEPGTPIIAGETRPMFLSTRNAEAPPLPGAATAHPHL